MSSRIGRTVLLACLAAVLAISGCGGGSATPATIYVTPSPGPSDTPAPSESPAESPASPTPTPVPVAATVTAAKETHTGSTGSCHDWTATIKKPLVSGVPPDAAAAMNAAVDAKVAGAIDAFEAVMAYGGGGAGPCTLAGDYSVALSTTSLLSLRFTFVQYTGGAGASTIAAGASFRTDGTAIALADLFTDPAAGAAKLSTESRSRLLAKLGSQGVDAGWVNPGTLPQLSSFDSAWAFTTAGLELTFQEITVAPHALGTPTIVIPWPSLAGVLAPDGPAGEFV
jgi:hypothetical protein